MNNEIINADYENIKYKSRISAVLAFERKSKVVDAQFVVINYF